MTASVTDKQLDYIINCGIKYRTGLNSTKDDSYD